ncbi:alpha/beta hydrolase [Nocardia sp. 2]|uniref:Alpha/beta hydrolase n=1 Tax=Nocardia acididurans TaxID=2802282 RepID=A0ABS1MFK1_9NOCA|nr:alpha/beta hydrolase [Nocardia acididurans]MBL1079397.1 alpha/beta hydrolase [Nocardia acididurans]
MATTDDSPTHTFGGSCRAALNDGRALHYRILENGSPTVVFESGMGMSGSIWGLVAPAVATQATTVVYNRAGTGRSDDDNQPLTLEHAVSDLTQLLRQLPPPFILVGASWGGPIIRSLTATKEFDVRGLVLVDQSDENAPEYFTPEAERRMERTAPFTLTLARLGLYRLASRIGRAQPSDVYKDFRHNDFGTRAARTMGREAHEFLPAMRRLQANPSRLEGVTVSVISGTKAGWIDKAQRPAINRAHRRTAEHLANGRFVEAQRSGHYVMFTEPELIVDEIARVMRGIL